jgi:hypothetical protein
MDAIRLFRSVRRRLRVQSVRYTALDRWFHNSIHHCCWRANELPDVPRYTIFARAGQTRRRRMMFLPILIGAIAGAEGAMAVWQGNVASIVLTMLVTFICLVAIVAELCIKHKTKLLRVATSLLRL